MMKRTQPTAPLSFGRRTRWTLIAIVVLLAPVVLLLPSSSAQQSRARVERSDSRKTVGEKKGKREKLPAAPAANAVPVKKPFRQDSFLSPEPVSSEAVNFAESRPLSEVAKKRLTRTTQTAESGEEESEAAENWVTRRVTAEAQARAAVAGGVKRDTAVQSDIPAPNIPSTILTFEGLGRTENIAAGFGNISPPDTNGDVGPNHYVQMDNDLVRVWNKAGTPLTAPFKLSALYTPLGGECAAPDKGDPVVLYDPLADRWMISQFAFASQTGGVYHQCIAISKTPDPTGAYYLYDFITGGNEFPDYPHLGVWPDGYYMTVHQFTAGGPFNGEGVYSFNRAKMLAGDPTANYIYFSLNLTSFPEAIGGMLPSDLDGLTPPAAGRPNTFVYFTSLDFGDPADGLRLFNFHADFTTPANSTFTERSESTYNAPLAVAPFSLVAPAGGPEGRAAVPQPSPAASAALGLDAIADRLMFRLQYRNRGGFETLVLTHTVGAPASSTFGTFRAAPRYYELRSTGGGPFSVQEQATYAPGGSPGDNVSRWLGSAAEDNQGNLAVGFNVSSGTAGGNVFPGIRYAGRLSTDPSGGLFQGEATLVAGTGAQTSTGNRWGDYSALTVDPSDDCTFWYTSEYYTAAGQAASSVGWQTRIGSFKFAQCSAPAKGTVHFTITNCVTNALIANAVVSVDGMTYGATLSNGTYDGTLAPGSHTYTVSKYGHTVATGNFSITDAQTTNVAACLDAGLVHFTVTNCATSAPLSGAAGTIDGDSVGTTNASGILDSAAVAGSHSYTFTKAHYSPANGSFNITNGQTTNQPVCLTPLAELSATKTADALSVVAGQQIGFNVTLTNAGSAAALDLTVTDNLPSGNGVNWVIDAGNTSAGWSVSGSAPNQSLVYTPTTIAAGASTHVHVVSATSTSCSGDATLNNTVNYTTSNDSSGQASASVSIVCPPTSAGPVTVVATAGTTGPTDYATVKGAFDAINAGTHQGAVRVWMLGNTTETAAAVLNASGSGSAVYTSVFMAPAGGARTVSGTLATPLIDLNGADNVIIDGLNSGGLSLTFSNASAVTTSGTSTIRFINGATNNKVTNCTINGSSTASTTVAGGNVLFSTSTVAGGNSNNTISKNNIGPAGANLPIKGVMGLGTAANPNANNLIDDNNVFDFFGSGGTGGFGNSTAGIDIQGNNNTWTISNNRIYQTATRTFTNTALRYSGILVNSASTFTVSNNRIGFANAAGTGTTTITGSSNEVRGIAFTTASTATPYSTISGNTISGINQTSSRASTSTDLPTFIGIQTGTSSFDAPANITGNTIGSLDGSSTIVINATSTTASSSPVQGILDFNFVDAVNISNNNIGSITINNGGTGTTVGFRGILVGSSTGLTHTVNNNTVASITDNIVGTYSMYGIQVSSANGSLTGNTIRNMTGNSNGAGLVVSAGILSSSSTGANTFSQNVVHSLSNNSGAASNAVRGFQCAFAAASNVVERNLVHSLSMTSTVTTGDISGIVMSTAAGTGTYRNNMIRLGVDAAGNSLTAGIPTNGILEQAGTNNVYFNSVYIGGSGVTSAGNTFAFNSLVVTNARNYRNNIFWNARSNASGAGKNYAISVGGTTANPAGLGSSNNDLYATGTGGFTGLFNAVDRASLANWQAATGQDAGSIAADPLFVAPTAAAATVNLHIQAGSPAISAANASTGVTNDYDADARDAAPDIGADEIPGALAATALTTASATGTYGGTVNLSATLTAGGSPLSGKTIDFQLNGNSVGSGTTNGSGVATLSNASLAGINAGSYPTGVGASFAGSTGYSASSATNSLTVNKATPVITWANPADIIYGTALSGTQLNATADTAGSFVYTPAAGTVLSSGNGQNLHADFTPTDTANYNNASKDVSINVLSAVLNISMTADRNPAPVEFNFNYKPVITNTGNAPATNVVLTDVLPSLVTYTAVSTSQGTCTYAAGTKTVTCNLGTINAGSSVNVQITVKPRSEGTLDDTASITGGQWDPATGNSSASVNGLPAIKFVDLAVSKSSSPNPIFVGQNTTYTMIVTNINTQISATGIVLTDSLPASMTFVSATTSQGGLVTPPVNSTGIVTANIGTLAVNATATVTITVKSTAAGVITNTATVTGNEQDFSSANNSASANTTVNTAALQKVLLAKQVLTGGCENTTGNVYLTGPAGPGGVTVNLSTTSLAGVTVPASVFIPAGQTVSPAFNVTTSPVVAKQVGSVNATLGQTTVSRGLTINVGSGSCPP
jgi:uncharacterized repeat protein (TIGR01451 family)